MKVTYFSFEKSAINGIEWEYMHLTPKGWVGGSIKIDGNREKNIPPPSNTVLTVYREVSVDAIGPCRSFTQKKRWSNKAWLINGLIVKFGLPQFIV